MVEALFMLTLLMPGTAVTYQGEEIGQTNTLIRPDQIRDPNNNGLGRTTIRDPQRGPFLWDNSENAGFTTAKKPWEPINPSYWDLNLAKQKDMPISHYKIYKDIVSLRSTPTILRGNVNIYTLSDWVFAFTRTLPGNDTYLCVINLGSEREVLILNEQIPNLPNTLTVRVTSMNSGYNKGDTVDTTVDVHSSTSPLLLTPKSSVVLLGSSSKPTPAKTTTDNPSTIITSSASILSTLDLFIVSNLCFVLYYIYI